MTSPLTHKGWFWFCPIYLSDPADADCLCVEARREWLEPLCSVAEWFERTRIFVSSIVIRDFEPSFMFKVTGERRSGNA